jgi:hypothetical protein
MPDGERCRRRTLYDRAEPPGGRPALLNPAGGPELAIAFTTLHEWPKMFRFLQADRDPPPAAAPRRADGRAASAKIASVRLSRTGTCARS